VCEGDVCPGVGHVLTRDVASQLDEFGPDPKLAADACGNIESFLRAQRRLPAN
jgi:hypothetical protein